MAKVADADPGQQPEPKPERVGKFIPPRIAVVDLLRSRLEATLQTVEGGPWDGVRVVTAKDLKEALSADLPPASLFSAEVRTPGWVTVAAVCPGCAIPTDIALVHPELVIDSTGAELRLKGKSKARTHVCGQTTLAEAADTDQASFGLEAVVGELCPFPDCILPAEHEGDHQPSAADDPDDEGTEAD